MSKVKDEFAKELKRRLSEDLSCQRFDTDNDNWNAVIDIIIDKLASARSQYGKDSAKYMFKKNEVIMMDLVLTYKIYKSKP